MRAFGFLLSLSAFLFSSTWSNGAEITNVPLSFYVVSEKKIEGGRFIDTASFPKLGYIGATPDLIITKLEDVATNSMKERAIMVDKNGREIPEPFRVRPALHITMKADDAKKFEKLTERAVGKQLLMMHGDKPLTAPLVRGPIPTSSFLLELTDKPDQKNVEEGLRKLVR